MPTISQLPAASSVLPSDVIPISQGGSVHAASVGTLLLTAQPSITIQSQSLLGRTSLGSGGPEQIDVGTGISLLAGTVVANGADHAAYPSTSSLSLESDLVISNQGRQMLMPTEFLRGLFSAGQNVAIDNNGVISTLTNANLPITNQLGTTIESLQLVASLGAQDLLLVNQAGTNSAVTYANLLDGLTIGQAQAAEAVSDSDAIWVAQGGDVMASQSFEAVWLWISTKMASYKYPIIEVTTNIALDEAVHNGRILICSQPVTLTPVLNGLGSGFRCQVINLSNGSVTLGTGFIASTGSLTVGQRQTVTIQCLSYSGGTIVYASFPGAASGVTAPGQVIQLSSSNVTGTSVTLVWQQPASGSSPLTYVVQYRQSGITGWTTSSTAVTANTYQVIGLQSNVSYDFVVQASSLGGTEIASEVLTVSTTSSQAQAPGQVIGLTAVTTSSSSILLSWFPVVGTNAAASYVVQYDTVGSVGSPSSITGVLTTTCNVTGLQAATGYSFSVAGANAGGVGLASSIVSASTTATGSAVSSITWNLGPSGIYAQSSGAIGVNAHVSPSSAAVQFGFSTSSTVAPSSWTVGLLVNTDLWGAYVPTPSATGSWYAWAEGVDGSSATVFSTPFTVQ